MSVPVYDQLRGLILSQEIGPDTILVETALAARLGVSRTPIREALRRLEQDGLIERTSRGTRVVERSPEQILEIMSFESCSKPMPLVLQHSGPPAWTSTGYGPFTNRCSPRRPRTETLGLR